VQLGAGLARDADILVFGRRFRVIKPLLNVQLRFRAGENERSHGGADLSPEKSRLYEGPDRAILTWLNLTEAYERPAIFFASVRRRRASARASQIVVCRTEG
jgi:hypothetical protein